MRLARLNSGGSLDTTFNAIFGPTGTVFSILPQPGNSFLIGGAFSAYNGVTSNRLARITSQGDFDNTFFSGFEDKPFAVVRTLLQQTDGKIVVGGVFNSYNGFARNSILRLTETNPRSAKFDYDGDGRSDAAVYRDGSWYILGSAQGFYGFQYGIATDTPAPADFDGDGKTDAAIYRDGVWYQLLTQSGSQVFQFGLAGDKPVPAAFVQ